MIEQKTLREITSDMRNNFQTAMGAVEKNNIDYAILLLKSLIIKEPGFMDAREQLRKVEKTKTKSAGFIAKTIGGIKAGSLAAKGKTKLGKSPKEAMKLAEDALAISLSNIPALNLLAQVGQALEADFITIEALELASEYHPKNEGVLTWLAEVYADIGMGAKTLQIRQQIAAMHPNDMNKQQDVRAAAALATIEKGKLDQDDFRQSLKDEDQAVKSEQDERIVRDIDDVKNLIEEYEQKIADGDGSMELHRKLAEMYQRGGDHDNALKYYNIVVEKMGTLDPHIDKAIEKSTVANFQAAIKQWEEYGADDPANKEEADKNIAEITSQMMEYKLERGLARVNLYPNDTELRFALATVYWDMNDVDNALQQFQIAQKNPHRRLTALVYLGRCFHAKGQNDIAVEQFEKAIEGLVAMNKEKMDALYYLAVTYEAMGDKEKAAATFKQIYQANVTFRDVAERMENLYK
jgi:tetratricopeptide (TPR) repeat protein